MPAFLNRFSRFPGWGGVCLLLLLLISLSGSWLITRKVVALMLMPTGVLWVIGLLAVFAPGIGKRTRFSLALLWIFYSLAGSPYLGAILLRTLEKPFYGSEEVNEPLDALVLLGGGTAVTPGGRPAMGTKGDRLFRSAHWYLSGKTMWLVTTGRSVTAGGKDRILSRDTFEIWQQLGIPEEAILELPDPRNTAEEMEAVAGLLERFPDWKRVGLCTSAAHLPRALKEAEALGLKMIPVPSDFRSARLPFSPLFLIPQARGFRDVQTSLWEYLGRLG